MNSPAHVQISGTCHSERAHADDIDGTCDDAHCADDSSADGDGGSDVVPSESLAAGLSPSEAARHMTVPPGFRVQLAAGEPDVHQPIGFALDERGRLWVAEAHTYPRRAPDGEGQDKITILEDTNGDGTLDSRKVFIEGLNLVSGIEVGFGGVWVGAAPYLMFIPDRDRNDLPDGEPEVLLDGFGYQDTHETLNAFNWGPDGWLYGCHGVFTHSLVGKPGTPKAQRVPLNAGVWRYHPLRHEFEVFAFGTSNPWGVDFNDVGQAFVTACVIPHLFHMVQGARYHRQGGRHFNPYTFDDIKTIADHAHFVGNIRDHAWWGHEPKVPQDTSLAGGGHAHCGAMIYLGDNWPDQYRDRIFFNNVHGNRVNCDILASHGSGYIGRHGKDLLLANDRWFRGINLKYGPDGAVYLIDWYDKNACHRNTPEIWDRTTGRIYKISYVDRENPPKSAVGPVAKPQLDLAQLDDASLVGLLSHRNDWYVRTARRLLQQRGGSPGIQSRLDKFIDDATTAPLQLRGLWALHVTGGLDASRAVRLLDSPLEYVRAWTIQLHLEQRQATPEFISRLVQMAERDASPVVRLYLASALQRLDLADRWQIAEALVEHAEDSEDHNLPLLYWYGIEPLVANDTPRAMQLARRSQVPLVKRYIVRRAASSPEMLSSVLALLQEPLNTTSQQLIVEEILHAFEGRVEIAMPNGWNAAYRQLLKSESEAVRDQADQIAILLGDKRIFPRMRELLVNRQSSMEKRRQALDILVRGRDVDAASAFQSVLDEPSLRGAAIRALAAVDDKQTPQRILQLYDRLTSEEQRDAIATLVARPDSALALLDAVSDGTIQRTDVHAYHIRQLQRFKNEKLMARIGEVWGAIRETSGDKKQKIAQLKSMLTTKRLAAANVRHGRHVFSKVCASCHVLFGEGGKVGPDITGSNRANLDYILENVVDPSAVLGKDYRMTIIATTTGRVISGLLLSESDSAVTLRTINDEVVVAKSEIDERQLSTQSLMPEQLLDQLEPDDVRDLIGYLGSPTQVGLSGPKAPIDPRTKRVPGVLEGEAMKVVGKTDGVTRGQSMASFTKDRWSGVDHLWWTGAKPGARLELELPVEKSGRYHLEAVFTMARDYGIIQLTLDSKPIGGPVDLFNAPDVITTGMLTFGEHQLKSGSHRLGIEIVGANHESQKSYMCGLDFVRLTPAEAD